MAAQPAAAKVVTPSLIGKTKTAVDLALKKAGLKLGKIRYATTGKGKPNTVVKQQPVAKTNVARGSAVDIWLLRKASPTVQKVEKTVSALPKARIYARQKT